MEAKTFIYIIIAGILALFIALFQYKYKVTNKSRFIFLVAILRFLTVFSILLLLINPKFEQNELSIEKPNLVLAVDNSSSIKYSGNNDKVEQFLEALTNNESLTQKFNVSTYTFGSELVAADSLSFNERQTNIHKAFSQLNEVYKNSVSPTVMVSDGNQTFGSNYEFSYDSYKQPIYPIIVGDTTSFVDLKISQLNVNRYTYLKNSFPVETMLTYNGNNSINTRFIVTSGSNTVYTETIWLSEQDNSKIINFTIPSKRVGVNTYRAQVVPLEKEKNTVNNSKNFAVEVIDQKTNIAIVSDFSHPDIGAFKKSIESNEQRSVKLINPNDIVDQTNDFQLIILYQPNYKFKSLIETLKDENINSFTVLGPQTDLNFLNSIDNYVNYEITGQLEDYQGKLNINYKPFYLEDINFESFAPLKSHYGNISFSLSYETILYKSLGGNTINNPLLVTYENSGRREAILFGENLWKWRAQSFLNTKSFNEFDNFIGKLVQYLASNKRRNRLDIDYESFYNGSDNIIIKAQFFDKNYIFDARQNVNMLVKDLNSNEEKTLPFVLKNNNYQVDLSSLSPSEYSFTVVVENENISRSGSFEILEYNVEQQFLNANVTKLQRLATNSLGSSHFIDNTDALFDQLLNDNRFVPIQKSIKKSIPLIDWKYLLIIIVICLSLEWFLRKYNGLI